MNKTITLHELCQRAANCIRQEPLNYDQSHWAIPAEYIHTGACGTAFCRAGWLVANVWSPLTPERWYQYSDSGGIHETAMGLLSNAGIDGDEIKALFRGDAICRETMSPIILKRGMEAYAEAGAQGLEAFMARNEDKLKAATVEVWEPDEVPTEQP